MNCTLSVAFHKRTSLNLFKRISCLPHDPIRKKQNHAQKRIKLVHTMMCTKHQETKLNYRPVCSGESRWECSDVYYFIIQTVARTIDAKYFPAGSWIMRQIAFGRCFISRTRIVCPEHRRYPCFTVN